MKKLSVWLLILIMLLSAFPMQAFAGSDTVQISTDEQVEPGAEMIVDTAIAYPDSEAHLGVYLGNDPGTAVINFTVEYDKTCLALIGYESELDWLVNIDEGRAVWVGDANFSGEGAIITLKFSVLPGAENGLAFVRLGSISTAGYDEQRTHFTGVEGGITVTDVIPGDLNKDCSVDLIDLLKMKKLLAGIETDAYEPNEDVTGDGCLGADDLLRLKKYIVGFDVTLERYTQTDAELADICGVTEH